MMISRNNVYCAAGTLALAVWVDAAHAQRNDDAARGFPARPIRVVIGFTPGETQRIKMDERKFHR